MCPRNIVLPLLLACTLVGCSETLEITPPKPNKGGKAGAGPAGGIQRDAPNGLDPDIDDRRLFRQLDDDVAAWHTAYASKDRMLALLETSLTKRAEAYYDRLVAAARGDHVPYAMVSCTALAFANRTDSAAVLSSIAAGDGDPRVVENAVNGLGILATRNPAAREEIPPQLVIDLLNDRRDPIRVAGSFVAMNLVYRGEDRGLQPYLAERTGDPDYRVRANACWAIGRAALPGATELLELRLLGDDSLEVRCNAALALAATGDRAAVEVLIDGLADEEEPVRMHCATALGLLTEQAFGMERARWIAWWEDNRASFEPRVFADGRRGYSHPDTVGKTRDD